jgi:dihydroorotase
MQYFFENILVIDPYRGIHEHRNILIEQGMILHSSTEHIEIPQNTIHIEASHLIAAPGFVDMHVHLREPGQEYKETIESGTLAAANGGFTDIVCMPNTLPALDSKINLEYVKNRAKDNIVNVHVCAATTIGREGKQLSPMSDLIDAGAIMFSDDGSCIENSEMMRRAFDYAAPFDALLTQHCEEHSLTKNFVIHEGTVSADLGLKGYPTVAEEIIVSRDIQLAAYCGNRRYHVSHLSTEGSVQLVREAKAKGQRISCEVTPHHFILTDKAVLEYGTHAKMNPPLREQSDIDAILIGLQDGTIDAIATDHAPHAIHEKNCELTIAANGITGIETCIGLAFQFLVNSNLISLDRFVYLLSTGPRNILQIQHPNLEKGESACITIFDKNAEWTVSTKNMKSKSVNTPFDNWKLLGKPAFIFNNNQVYKSEL